MKRLSSPVTWLLLFLLFSPAAFGESEEWKKVAGDYQRAEEKWRAAGEANKDGKIDPARLEAAVRALKPLLKIRRKEGPYLTGGEEGRLELMDWVAAKAWADAGKYEDSLRCLKAQAAEGGILGCTRNPNSFAIDVFALHAKIMAETGKVTAIPDSGYKVFAVPSAQGLSRYAFVWEPEGEFIGDMEVRGVAEDEQRKAITLFECGKSRACNYVGSAQVVSKRDNLKVSLASRPGRSVLVLAGVVKVLEFKGEFHVPFVHPSPQTKIELRLDLADDLEQPLDAIAGMNRKPEEAK